MKPLIYVVNVDEDSYADPFANPYFKALDDFAKENGALCIPVSAKMEEDLSKVSPEDRREYLESLGTTQTGLDKITFAAYSILGLRTFFTGGEDAVRACTFHEGYNAPQWAGDIHTDIEKNYTKAKVYHYDDLIQ